MLGRLVVFATQHVQPRDILIFALLAAVGTATLRQKMAESSEADAMARVRASAMLVENLRAEAALQYFEADTWRRRALQVTIELDEKDRELRERPVVRATAVIDPDEVETEVAVEVADSVITFSHEDALLSLDVEIGIAGGEIASEATLRYNLKPITVSAGVRCTAPNEDGVSSALVTVATVPVVELEILDPQVDPEVCNAVFLNPETEDGPSRLRWFAGGIVTVLAAITLTG